MGGAPERAKSRLDCKWPHWRCYAPSMMAMAMVAVILAYGLYAMQGFDIQRIGWRHCINCALLWFVISPVIVGLMRGVRRSRRHLTRARDSAYTTHFPSD